MSDNIIRGYFPGDSGGAGEDGGGPEDPVLEKRVDRLEADVAEMKATLRAHSSDLSEIKLALVKLDAKLDKLDAKFDGKLGEMDGRLSGKLGAIDGRLAGIEGRISSVEWRLNQIPGHWQMLGLIATLLIGLAGLMFTAGKFLHP